MTHIILDARRLTAVSALLIVSSLQISGCNPAPDSPGVLELGLSSLNSGVSCIECKIERQASLPFQRQDHLLLAGAERRMSSEATIQQALQPGDEGSSFYNPESDDAGGLSDSRTGKGWSDGAGSPGQAPLRRPSPSLDSRFTPWPIPESVFFLYRRREASAAMPVRVPLGTAFILSVPDANHRTVARFLVTARHVLDPKWAHCSEQNPATVEVGLNRRSGGVGYETLSLDNTTTRSYFVPADGTSDIAIIRLDERLIPDLESYKFVDTPFRLLPTEADLRMILGAQQIVTASVQEQPQAELETFPISGLGVLSSTTSELVDIHCGNNPAARPLNIWFIGGSVRQGVSGAPVYTSLVRDGQTTPTTVLLGVQAIAWPNRGVAGITPSSALADLVESALGRASHGADFYRGATP